MKELIKRIETLMEDLAKVSPQTPHLVAARCGLQTARDNLVWGGDAAAGTIAAASSTATK